MSATPFVQPDRRFPGRLPALALGTAVLLGVVACSQTSPGRTGSASSQPASSQPAGADSSIEMKPVGKPPERGGLYWLNPLNWFKAPETRTETYSGRYAGTDNAVSLTYTYDRDFADPQRTDLKPAKQGGKWGYTDALGRWVIPPQFERAEKFQSGRARVRVGGSWLYINPAGKYVQGASKPSWFGGSPKTGPATNPPTQP